MKNPKDESHMARDMASASNQGIEAFGARLKLAMNGVSPRAFAQQCEMSEGALWSYLRGSTFPTLDRLDRLAKACGRSPAWLAFGADAPVGHAESDLAVVPIYESTCAGGHGSWRARAKQIGALPLLTSELKRKGVAATDLSAVSLPVETVVFNHSLAALQGDGRYVLDFDGQLCTRRLQRQFDGSVLILGEEHGFKDMLVPRHHVDQIAVAGPCIWADTWLV
ncbi:helix-turn-helix domain-containing protein [Pseudomonas nitroreducens]